MNKSSIVKSVSTRRCPHCQADHPSYLYTNTDYISKEDFQILNCLQCGLSWTDVQLEQFDPSPYYPQEYYGKKNIRFRGGIENLIKKFRSYRAQIIEKYAGISNGGRILDIGCGRGLMLGVLKERGWQAVGIEHSEQASQYARELLGVDVHVGKNLSECAFEQNSFDVVTLWHVLEHLKAPDKTLQEIQHILKPQGLLIIEVPNHSSWQSRLGSGKWFHLDAPRHFFHFSQETLLQLLEELGFEIVKKNTLSLEYGPFGMIQTMLNKITFQPNFLFSLLKNKSAKDHKLRRKEEWFDLLVSLLLVVPCVMIGSLLELLAIVFNRGGIVCVIARKK